MSTHLRPRQRGLAVGILAGLLVGTLAISTGSLAYYTDVGQANATVSAGRIFPATRTTSAFAVGDASAGGGEADRSSAFALPGDGRTVSTGAWATAFASNRFLQFDLSAPLPAAVGASGVSFGFSFSGASPSASTCTYVEVRRASDGAVLATYGSPGSPLACVGGTAPTSLSVPLPVVTTTDAANDLRVRVYGRDTAGVGSVIDEATVSGSTPYVSFTLYPVRFTDAAGPDPMTSPWDLQGP